MTNTKYLLVGILGLALAAQSAFAGDEKSSETSDMVEVGVDMRVRYDGQDDGTDWNSNVSMDDAHVFLSAALTDKIKARLRVDLAPFFDGGDWKERLEKAIEEATIEIRNINGLPVAAVIFGKQNVFKANSDDLPAFKDGLLYDLATKEEVIGLTIELKELLGFVISASAFETESGDLKFGDSWGFSVEATRNLSNAIKVKGSLYMAQNGGDDFSDRRASVGLVYDGGDGKWSAHLEGLYFEGVCGYGDGYGVGAGASVAVGPGRARIEAAYLENVAYEVAAAYDLPVGDGILVSPAVRHRMNEGGDDETRAMVEARIRLGQSPDAVR